MDKREVDVAIIGAGTAGLVAYRQAARATDRVVLIEGEQYGTTCARVGCMPSKLLIAAAERAHDVRHAGQFGVHVGDVQVDGRAVMERVRRERDRFVEPVVKAAEALPEEHRLMGHARFVGSHRLVVGEHTEVQAGRIVIATGSRPHIPAPFKGAKDRLIVNDDVFDWQDLPESVAVFGPGVIGLELGQALARLGVRVRLFGVDGGIGGLQDGKILDRARRIFAEELALSLSAKTETITRTDQGVEITFSEDGRTNTETFDYLLAATGRRPNIDHLDIQNAGIELDDKGMPEFDPYTLRCGDSHIFIAGDVNNDRPLLHEAADEGRIAGKNAGTWPDVRTGLRKTPVSVVFSDPQIARVGYTLAQVGERCQGCFAVGEVSFDNQGRSRVIAKNAGLLRVYGEHGSGLFMGAEMLGPAAEHLAHLLAWAAQQRMTVKTMLEMPFYHPVIEEGLRTALKGLNRNLQMGPEQGDECMECGPGG
ncbi:dihydrolipoamide dehydrogenase [Marinobacter persicus]|uniref:Dihydrolipoamide dehydrogenase n=1 Tax=Marinobacter persicus TaxID=930118 RepID=A0A1I3QXX0_9GAMM|nr:dihydrolipoyl dehydrogenase [Marinobacter persicus]GHD43132.1 dihydrolipoyl dehydrogenase [Marinobacter persicus]SFJ38131.1 dihydrolipoamide dehydrogenase [Marinobacter persicus]